MNLNTLFVLSVVLFPLGFEAHSKTLENCQVTRMMDSKHFEAALSVEEYPNVSVKKEDMTGSFSVSVGAVQDWSQDQGDDIQILPSVGFGKHYTFHRRGDSDTYHLSVSSTRDARIGKLYVANKPGDRPKVIAYLNCP